MWGMAMLDRYRDESIIIVDEVLALLQSKRTSLKTIRLGIGIFVADLSFTSLLVVVYHRSDLAPLVIRWLPVISLFGVILLCLAIYLIASSTIHIHRLNRKLHDLSNTLHQMGFSKSLEI